MSGVRGVDCHAHVLDLAVPLVAERHSAPSRDATTAEFLELLTANGLSHGVLTAPSFYGENNALLLAALRTAPERLRGTVIVAPDVDERVLTSYRDEGVVGVRLNWRSRGDLPKLDGPEYDRLFALLRELDMHVEMLVEIDRLAGLLPTLRRHRVSVVVDHFGLPDPTNPPMSAGMNALVDAVADGSTWVKLSAPYRLQGADPRPYVGRLLSAGGPRRLLWGSDWPWVQHEDATTYPSCLRALEAWVPDTDAQRIVLTDSPAELFGFGHPATGRERHNGEILP